MSTARDISPLEIMTPNDVRVANESGQVFVVLAPSLTAVLSANEADFAMPGFVTTDAAFSPAFQCQIVAAFDAGWTRHSIDLPYSRLGVAKTVDDFVLDLQMPVQRAWSLRP